MLFFAFLLILMAVPGVSGRQLKNQKYVINCKTLGELELAPPTNSILAQPQGLLLFGPNLERERKQTRSNSTQIITRSRVTAAERKEAERGIWNY